MGKHPSGYVIFTPEARVFFVLTGEGRKPAKTAEEKAELLNSLVAYTGTYRVEGDNWITSVEVAWNPAWVGTEQSTCLQGGRGTAASSHPLARHAQLGRQGHDPQHHHV